MTGWILDHLILISLLTIGAVLASVIGVFRYFHRLYRDESTRPAIAGAVVNIIFAVIFSLWLNNLFALKRERDGRLWGLRLRAFESSSTCPSDGRRAVAAVGGSNDYSWLPRSALGGCNLRPAGIQGFLVSRCSCATSTASLSRILSSSGNPSYAGGTPGQGISRRIGTGRKQVHFPTESVGSEGRAVTVVIGEVHWKGSWDDSGDF
jgi:hypothetical protein